jgi:hypothetical protein
VAALYEDAFKLTLLKATSLTPSSRTRDEIALEYAQAVGDVTSGRFVPEEESEIFDLCALAWFKELVEEPVDEGAPALTSADVAMSAATRRVKSSSTCQRSGRRARRRRETAGARR